ncbi:MAG: hypothetical protein ACPGJS_00325 [Flammeovirgaceae bacterium]
MRLFILLVGFLLIGSSSFASSADQFASSTANHMAMPVAAKQKKTFKEKLTYMVAKKLYKKAQRKAKKKGLKPMAEFEDFAALAGAIVCIAGIISIIGNPVGGIIVALLGLVIYVLARGAGGSIGAIFS